MSKISTEKPQAPVSRFSKAKDFATDTDIKVGIEATPEPTAVAKAKPAVTSQSESITKRENFDLDVELGREMRQFLLTSRRFRTKRDFLTQCLRDGLKQYEGK